MAHKTIDEARPIAFEASEAVRAALAGIGRTEDVQFSPDGARLAIAGFARDRLLILDVETRGGQDDPAVTLTGFVEIQSDSFHSPHGVSWAGEDTLIVANREGHISVVAVEPGGTASRARTVREIGADGADLIKTPGSLLALPVGMGLIELLVCNNYVNYVTRHLIDQRNDHAVIASDMLIAEGIEVPDSVAVSPSRTWIAISNHDRHNILLYRNDERLNAQSKPDAVLTGVYSPHGLKFVGDDGILLVADAGAPYVFLFASGGRDWAGEYAPSGAIRVLDEETFKRGNYDPTEGGPKGLDLSADRALMVVTGEYQPLAFFETRALIEPIDQPSLPVPDAGDVERMRATMIRHLVAAGARAVHETEVVRRGTEHHSDELAAARREVQDLRSSRSWKITAPLRYLTDRCRGRAGRG